MFGMKRRVAFWAVSFSALGGTFNGVVNFQRSICGDTYGSIQAQAKGHTWQEAACTQPKSCAVCGADSLRGGLDKRSHRTREALLVHYADAERTTERPT